MVEWTERAHRSSSSFIIRTFSLDLSRNLRRFSILKLDRYIQFTTVQTENTNFRFTSHLKKKVKTNGKRSIEVTRKRPSSTSAGFIGIDTPIYWTYSIINMFSRYLHLYRMTSFLIFYLRLTPTLGTIISPDLDKKNNYKELGYYALIHILFTVSSCPSLPCGHFKFSM